MRSTPIVPSGAPSANPIEVRCAAVDAVFSGPSWTVKTGEGRVGGVVPALPQEVSSPMPNKELMATYWCAI